MNKLLGILAIVGCLAMASESRACNPVVGAQFGFQTAVPATAFSAQFSSFAVQQPVVVQSAFVQPSFGFSAIGVQPAFAPAFGFSAFAGVRTRPVFVGNAFVGGGHRGGRAVVRQRNVVRHR